MAQALQVGVVKPLAGWLTQQQLAWLEQHVEGLPPAHDAEALATFLTGISKAGFEYPAEHYGCLLIAQQVRTLHLSCEEVETLDLLQPIRADWMNDVSFY